MARRPASADRTVLMLAVHPPNLAATRLRLHQYRAHLELSGWTTNLLTLFDPDDVEVWHSPAVPRRASLLIRRTVRLVLRLALAVRRADAIIVQREVLPLPSSLLERILARLRPLVWDVDDAIWVPFRSPTARYLPWRLRASRGKYVGIARAARETWAGSVPLCDAIRAWGVTAHLVPTVTDSPTHRPPTQGRDAIVWIGSHSTYPFVEPMLQGIRDVAQRAGMETVVMGAGALSEEIDGVDYIPWTPHAERALLERAAVGLYPLDPMHPSVWGKCALKAILYMAHGVPVIASPDKAVLAVMPTTAGLLAENTTEFIACMGTLLSDLDSRDHMSAAGFAAADAFSLRMWEARLATMLDTVALND